MGEDFCKYAGLTYGDGNRICWYSIYNGLCPSGTTFVNDLESPLPVVAQQMCRVNGNVELCLLPGGANPPVVRSR